MNLRSIMDGFGQLQLNKIPVPSEEHTFRVQDDVIIRRKVHRTGPTTNQVMVGKILAMGDDGIATVTVQGPGGNKHMKLSLNELAPVTEAFRRSSMQLNPAFRPHI